MLTIKPYNFLRNYFTLTENKKITYSKLRKVTTAIETNCGLSGIL